MFNELKLLVLGVFLIAVAAGLFQALKHISPTTSSPTPLVQTITSTTTDTGFSTAASTTPSTPPVPIPPKGGDGEAISGVEGTLTIGPTCPVMRNPPEPQCADKPYQTTLVITSSISGKVAATVHSDAQGHYTQELPNGTYIIKAASSATLPHLSPATFIVDDGMTILNLTFDSGIR